MTDPVTTVAADFTCTRTARDRPRDHRGVSLMPIEQTPGWAKNR